MNDDRTTPGRRSAYGEDAMQEARKYAEWEIKPGELGPWNMLFLQVVFAVGISLPILLCGYGIISYFFFGVR